MENLQPEKEQLPTKLPIFKWRHFFLLLLLYVGMMFAVIIPLVVYDLIKGSHYSDLIINGPFQALILDAGIVFLIILIMKPVRRNVFNKQTWNVSVFKERKTYAVIVSALLINYVFEFIIHGIFHMESVNKQLKYLNLVPHGNYGWITFIFIFLGIVIITPIKEEILFRLIPNLLLRRYHVLLVIIVSTVLFAAGHTGVYFSAGFMGLLFMLSYLYTKSLTVSFVIHSLWNFYSFCTLFFF
ncbi:MAG: type II CAAX endopeptidase family protein [Bacillota bacterium]|nr:type II CAAX endopeptidase family protein [Bacillota bacterium]